MTDYPKKGPRRNKLLARISGRANGIIARCAAAGFYKFFPHAVLRVHRSQAWAGLSEDTRRMPEAGQAEARGGG